MKVDLGSMGDFDECGVTAIRWKGNNWCPMLWTSSPQQPLLSKEKPVKEVYFDDMLDHLINPIASRFMEAV